MEFLVIEAVLIVISIITANVMVKKRIWFTKRFIIGKESNYEVEKLKLLAEELLSKEVTDPSLNGLTISVEIKDGKIVESTVESGKTKVMCSEENGTRVLNQALSQKGALVLTSFVIWGVALWLHIIITLLYGMYVLNQMIP